MGILSKRPDNTQLTFSDDTHLKKKHCIVENKPNIKVLEIFSFWAEKIKHELTDRKYSKEDSETHNYENVHTIKNFGN